MRLGRARVLPHLMPCRVRPARFVIGVGWIAGAQGEVGLVVLAGVGGWVGMRAFVRFWLGGAAAFQCGQRLVEVAVVPGGVAGELREDLGGVAGQIAVCGRKAERDTAAVRVLADQGVVEGGGGGDVGLVEEAGLDDGEAVALPGGGDDFVDEGGFDGADGFQVPVKAAAAVEEVLAVLGGQEDGVGQAAVARGVLGADRLAFGGTGAGGFLGVAAVGLDLAFGWHTGSSGGEYGMGVGGKRAVGVVSC